MRRVAYKVERHLPPPVSQRYDSARLLEALRMELLENCPEPEWQFDYTTDSELDADSLPGFLAAITASRDEGDAPNVLLNLRRLRHTIKHCRGLVLEHLVNEDAFSLVATCFLDCPNSGIKHEALHTLYAVTVLFPAVSRVVTELIPPVRLFSLLESPIFSLIAPASVLLAMHYEIIDDPRRALFRAQLPIGRIYDLHVFVWNHRAREIHRIHASYGYLHILEMYCELPVPDDDMPFVMSIIAFICELCPGRYSNEYAGWDDGAYSLIDRHMLLIIQNLTKSGALSTELFLGHNLHNFVSDQFASEYPRSRQLACSIWTNLLTPNCDTSPIPFVRLFGLVNGDTGGAALKLIARILNCSSDRDGYIQLLLFEASTSKKFWRRLRGHDQSFVLLEGCGALLIELLRQPRHDEMARLANGQVLELLAECLQVENEGIVLGVLQGISRMAEFARGQGADAWREFEGQFVGIDGLDVLRGLEMDFDQEEILALTHQLAELFQTGT
jgi:hypothetical protein